VASSTTSTSRATASGEPLQHVLAEVLATIDGARHASVARLVDGGFEVVASTDVELDDVLATYDGPQVEAVELARTVRIPSTQSSTTFVDYSAACRARGVYSVAAFPLWDDTGALVAVLTVTSYDHHGFGVPDMLAARRLGESMVPLIASDRGIARRRRGTLAP
jgi:hypothetical protein